LFIVVGGGGIWTDSRYFTQLFKTNKKTERTFPVTQNTRIRYNEDERFREFLTGLFGPDNFRLHVSASTAVYYEIALLTRRQLKHDEWIMDVPREVTEVR
jgi:hypothetical protein